MVVACKTRHGAALSPCGDMRAHDVTARRARLAISQVRSIAREIRSTVYVETALSVCYSTVKVTAYAHDDIVSFCRSNTEVSVTVSVSMDQC